MAKPNFNFQKRQKEIAKKKKNEEKRQRKLDKNTMQPAENPVQSPPGQTPPIAPFLRTTRGARQTPSADFPDRAEWTSCLPPG